MTTQLVAPRLSTINPSTSFFQNYPLGPPHDVNWALVDEQSDDALPRQPKDEFDHWAALNHVSRLYYHKAMPKEQRRLMCCRIWGEKTNVRTGRYVSFPFRCQDYRGCPNCRSVKAEELSVRISNSVIRYGRNSVIMVKLDQVRASRVIKQEGKDNVLRIPGEHEDVLFIANCDIQQFRDVGFERLSDKKVWKSTPWLKILKLVPRKRNMSGGLGRATKKREGHKITQPTFLTEATWDQKQAVREKAFSRSKFAGHKPLSYVELQVMVAERAALEKEEFENSGIQINYSYPCHEYVTLKEVKWEKTQSDGDKLKRGTGYHDTG